MKRDSTDFVVIHCSATPPDLDIGRDEIDVWHRARGWNGVGYHFVIRRDGELEYGRQPTKKGAHAGAAYNNRSLGLCMIGGVNADGKPESNFTAAQWSTLLGMIDALKLVWPDAKVIGHNEVSAKACPSFDVQAWLSTPPMLSLRKAVPSNGGT